MSSSIEEVINYKESALYLAIENFIGNETIMEGLRQIDDFNKKIKKYEKNRTMGIFFKKNQSNDSLSLMIEDTGYVISRKKIEICNKHDVRYEVRSYQLVNEEYTLQEEDSFVVIGSCTVSLCENEAKIHNSRLTLLREDWKKRSTKEKVA